MRDIALFNQVLWFQQYLVIAGGIPHICHLYHLYIGGEKLKQKFRWWRKNDKYEAVAGGIHDEELDGGGLLPRAWKL